MRLHRLQEALGPDLAVEWRTFMLRPRPAGDVPFKGTYREEGWRRCGQMSAGDGITFTPWPHASLPAWSLPAHEAAKCAARQDAALGVRVHMKLYEAYFSASRNIADADEVARVVSESGADMDRFRADVDSGWGRAAALAEHAAAEQAGVQAIPTVIVDEGPRPLVGLADLAAYRAAIAAAGG